MSNGVPPSTVVTTTGNSGVIISLAMSFSNETKPSTITTAGIGGRTDGFGVIGSFCDGRVFPPAPERLGRLTAINGESRSNHVSGIQRFGSKARRVIGMAGPIQLIQ